MKKFTTLFALLATFVLISPVYAGTGHAHDKDGGHSNHGHGHGPIDAEKAKAKATKTMISLAKRGVIDQSWTSTQPIKVEKKTFAKGEEWVVSFNNDQLKEKAKQTLYIFYSLDGHYIAANYTGK